VKRDAFDSELRRRRRPWRDLLTKHLISHQRSAIHDHTTEQPPYTDSRSNQLKAVYIEKQRPSVVHEGRDNTTRSSVYSEKTSFESGIQRRK